MTTKNSPSIATLIRISLPWLYGLALTVALLVPDPWKLLTGQPSEKQPKVMEHDHAIHFTAYFLWGLLLAVCIRRTQHKWTAQLFALLAAHGVATEVGQHFVPTRYMDFMDAGLDVLGAAVGMGIVLAVRG